MKRQLWLSFILSAFVLQTIQATQLHFDDMYKYYYATQKTFIQGVGVEITVRYPVAKYSGEKFPALFFLGGRQLKTYHYSTICKILASYGFVVIQYDLFWRYLGDRYQLKLVPGIVDYIRNSPPGSQFSDAAQVLDEFRLGVSGHSRGGSLSVLNMINSISCGQHGLCSPLDGKTPARIMAVSLVDPVDLQKQRAENRGYVDYRNPSSMNLLQNYPVKLSIIGSGIPESCKGIGSYEKFFQHSAPGSEEIVIEGVRHMDFADDVGRTPVYDDLLCFTLFRATSVWSNQETINLTAPLVAQWMFRQMYTDATLPPGGQRFMIAYQDWYAYQLVKDYLTVQRK